MRGLGAFDVGDPEDESRGNDGEVDTADGEFRVADFLMRLSMALRFSPSGTEKSGQPTKSKCLISFSYHWSSSSSC